MRAIFPWQARRLSAMRGKSSTLRLLTVASPCLQEQAGCRSWRLISNPRRSSWKALRLFMYCWSILSRALWSPHIDRLLLRETAPPARGFLPPSICGRRRESRSTTSCARFPALSFSGAPVRWWQTPPLRGSRCAAWDRPRPAAPWWFSTRFQSPIHLAVGSTGRNCRRRSSIRWNWSVGAHRIYMVRALSVALSASSR